MKLQFEAGSGRKYSGVNFLAGEDDHLSIYAEVEIPEGASEDYGYLTMKRAILERLPDAGLTFWYDGQEHLLAQDAAADCPVYLEIGVEE